MTKKLDNLYKLRHTVAVTVPGTNGVNTAADNSDWQDRVAAHMSEWFGGASGFPHTGYWMSPEVGLVKEENMQILSYCSTEALDAHGDDLVELCEEMKKALSQEAIAIEKDHEMMFV